MKNIWLKIIGKNFHDKHFRVAIYGSARIKPGDSRYHQIHELAKMIGNSGIDIVTGGGPGIMEAANKGHKIGAKHKHVHSIGLNIELPREQKSNEYLDFKKEFHRFTKRLDYFISLSDVVVVAPGGIGTLLEFLYTWQLIQVKHACNIPIILIGPQWKGFLKWITDGPLEKHYLDKKDLESIFYVHNNKQALEIIKRAKEHREKSGNKNVCINLKKYKLKV